VRIFGGLLTVFAVAGLFYTLSRASISGNKSDTSVAAFFVVWGFFGPVFLFGLFLAMGGAVLSSRTKMLFIVSAVASIALAYVLTI
jgi:hypothetical protein